MPYDNVAIPAFSGSQEQKSYLCLYDSKSLEAMQYSVGDELVLTVIARLTSKSQSENNTPGSSRRVEFDIKSVAVEAPLKTKLKGQII